MFKIGTGGALNEIAGSPFASGGQAYSVALDNTGKYAYAANRLNGTIYGYSDRDWGGIDGSGWVALYEWVAGDFAGRG